MGQSKISIEITRHKDCGVDATYDLVTFNEKNEPGTGKTMCFDKTELLEKINVFLKTSLEKDG